MSEKPAVWEDEITATEQWIGRPLPDSLKDLWARSGRGPVAGGEILGPFDLIDAVPGLGGALPFFRDRDGRTYRVDAAGRVLDHAGHALEAGPADVVRQAADAAALDEAVSRVSGNALSRGLRSIVAAVSTRRFVEQPRG